MLIFAFFLLHLLIIFLILNEQKKKKLVLNPFLLFVLVLFPIVGAASVYLYNSQRRQAGHQPAPSFERVIPWMSDESLTEDEDTRDVSSMDAKEIIPFQEALLLNNAGVKRSLIIDLIFERPDQFVPLLYQARLNDDVEVVHYATTILSELTSKYDAKLQDLEGRMLAEPDSLAAKEAYLQYLQLYIDSQLAEGYYAKRLRQRYAELVRSLQHQGLLLELPYFVKLGEIYLELEDREGFSGLLEQMQELFPLEEETWMLRLKAIVAQKSQSDLRHFLAELKDRQIYLSAKNREILAFWQ